MVAAAGPQRLPWMPDRAVGCGKVMAVESARLTVAFEPAREKG
jgi:hypothetical protein